ncbi:MAG: hypothetical protein HY904_01570 [Deltaproteobacteria bacterium]|nr:hypothetical protein [Deltaproteobacteria bacterium]
MTLEQGVLVGLVLGWFGVSLYSRYAGALLGIALAAAVGAWGFFVMVTGRQIHLVMLPHAFQPVRPAAFFTFISLLVLGNLVSLLRAWRDRRLLIPPPSH